MVDFIVDPDGNARDCRTEAPASDQRPSWDWKTLGYLTGGMLGLQLWVCTDLLALERGEVRSIFLWKPIAQAYKMLGFTGAVLVLPILWTTFVFGWGCVSWLNRFGRGRLILESIESCVSRLARALSYLLALGAFGVGVVLLSLVAGNAITGGNRIPPWLVLPALLLLGLSGLIIARMWRRR